mgnify:CR=1 FL=1
MEPARTRISKVFAKTLASVRLLEEDDAHWYVLLSAILKLTVLVMAIIAPPLVFAIGNMLDETAKAILGTAVPTTVVASLYLYYHFWKNEIESASHWYAQHCDKVFLTRYANRIVYIAMVCGVSQTLLFGGIVYWARAQ